MADSVYDQRKTEIIDTAEMLFNSVGYTNTSVSMIIEKLGIAKGTFYHYFKSKAELMDAVTRRFVERRMDVFEKIVANKEMNGLEKLRALFADTAAYKTENIDIVISALESWLSDDNVIIRNRMEKLSREYTYPLVGKIIKQGAEEGHFNLGTTDYSGLSDLLLMMGMATTDRVGKLILDINRKPENVDKIKKAMDLWAYGLNQLLGTPPGTITFDIDDFIKALRAYLKAKEQ